MAYNVDITFRRCGRAFGSHLWKFVVAFLLPLSSASQQEGRRREMHIMALLI